MLTDYTALTVAEMSELRRHLGKGVKFKVAKNTLARIASEGTPSAVASSEFKGQIGLAFGFDDPVLAVKKVLEFSKKNEKLKMRAGVVEGKLFGQAELVRIAELPPREVLLGTLAGAMQAPIAKLGAGLYQSIARLAHALNALKEKKSAA